MKAKTRSLVITMLRMELIVVPACFLGLPYLSSAFCCQTVPSQSLISPELSDPGDASWPGGPGDRFWPGEGGGGAACEGPWQEALSGGFGLLDGP